MNQNPYIKDWLRSIESMNEEELIKVIEDDSRNEEQKGKSEKKNRAMK